MEVKIILLSGIPVLLLNVVLNYVCNTHISGETYTLYVQCAQQNYKRIYGKAKQFVWWEKEIPNV